MPLWVCICKIINLISTYDQKVVKFPKKHVSWKDGDEEEHASDEDTSEEEVEAPLDATANAFLSQKSKRLVEFLLC